MIIKKKLSILLIFLAFNLFALEDIEKLLIEKAQTPEEKKIVQEYLLKISKDHKEIAEKYRRLAKTKTGGKVRYQKDKQKEMNELAKKFEEDSKVYENAANSLE